MHQALSPKSIKPLFIGHSRESLHQPNSTAIIQFHYLWYAGWNAQNSQASKRSSIKAQSSRIKT
jgi:hypothetical protein